MPNNNSKTLYHYCSNTVLHSILSNKEIWLSDLSQSNDYLEGKWFLEELRRYLKGNQSLSERQKNLIKSVENYAEQSHPLGFCMSTKGDLLSQWRGYADNGQGVSIGFDKCFFEHHEHGIDLFEVNYDTGNALQNLFAEQMFEGFMNSSNDFVDNDFVYFAALLSKRFRVKNPAFQEEQEWRFMRDISSSEPKLKVHATADTLKPYIPISLLGYTQNPIREVILGPKNKTKKTTLRYLLDVSGFNDADIQSSEASYQ